MTNKRAIEILNLIWLYNTADIIRNEDIKKALTMAIQALEKEPCEDAISRQAMLAIAGDSCLDLDSYEDTWEFCDQIKALPPVTPQKKTLNEIRKSHGLPEITARMTIKEAIEFFEEQQEIFGDTECLMHGALSMAQEIFEKIENCDESSATRCFNCINEIKENYREEQKNV